MKIAGRKVETALLQSLLEKDESSFVAVYGRRRIGKTYLIRQVYQENMLFECSGVNEDELSQQIDNFWVTFNETIPNEEKTELPKTWIQAFGQLRAYIKPMSQETKKVIFLDELPWFETPKSGFLAAVDIFWNQFCTKRTDIVLVICGSAASWIIDRVVNDRGGLHNRLTNRILLKPFTLKETQAFFELYNVKMSLRDITQIYMAIGGIPFYLKDIKSGYSVPQMLDQLFFEPQATLKNEFQNLYASLFKNNTLHEAVVDSAATRVRATTRPWSPAPIPSGPTAAIFTSRGLEGCG